MCGVVATGLLSVPYAQTLMGGLVYALPTSTRLRTVKAIPFLARILSSRALCGACRRFVAGERLQAGMHSADLGARRADGICCPTDVNSQQRLQAGLSQNGPWPHTASCHLAQLALPACASHVRLCPCVPQPQDHH
eukprot:5693649-Pleurochrysis_carterae.AAC.2